MNKIKLNNAEFEIENYNKSTYFGGDTITSNANFQLTTNDITLLNALVSETITSIQIIHDDTVIYNLTDINAHIDNINEYLNFDRMNINVSMRFDPVVSE